MQRDYYGRPVYDANDYFMHYGRKGMKWGKNIFETFENVGSQAQALGGQLNSRVQSLGSGIQSTYNNFKSGETGKRINEGINRLGAQAGDLRDRAQKKINQYKTWAKEQNAINTVKGRNAAMTYKGIGNKANSLLPGMRDAARGAGQTMITNKKLWNDDYHQGEKIANIGKRLRGEEIEQRPKQLFGLKKQKSSLDVAPKKIGSAISSTYKQGKKAAGGVLGNIKNKLEGDYNKKKYGIDQNSLIKKPTKQKYGFGGTKQEKRHIFGNGTEKSLFGGNQSQKKQLFGPKQQPKKQLFGPKKTKKTKKFPW